MITSSPAGAALNLPVPGPASGFWQELHRALRAAWRDQALRACAVPPAENARRVLREIYSDRLRP